MPLTDKDRAAAHAAYPRVLAALNGMSVEASFSLMGAVFSQILEATDPNVAHAAIDNFANAVHDMIDK